MTFICDCSARLVESEPAIAKNDESESDLAQPDTSARKQGRNLEMKHCWQIFESITRRSSHNRCVQTPELEETSIWTETEPASDGTEETSLLSPSTKDKAKGRVSASGLVVSAKDGRRRSRI